MKIGLASDHGGVRLKKKIMDHLSGKGYEVSDYGTTSTESVDYPDHIKLPCLDLVNGKIEKAIVVCGSGVGASITANKIRGIRCALCFDLYTAEMSRLHNDSNVLALGERNVDGTLALNIVDRWLETEFEGGRHIKRLEKIKKIEDEQC